MSIIANSQTSLNIAISSALASGVIKPAGDLNSQDPINFTNGTGANQINQIYVADYTGTGDVTLDLYGGTLLNPNNEAIVFTGIREIVIVNQASTTAYNLLVGGAASNPFSAFFADPSDVLKVGPGGRRLLTEPIDALVVDATHRNLKIARGGNSIPFRVIILGIS